MPDEIEIDTDKLRETIDHEVHHEMDRSSGMFLRLVALATAILAALTAVVSLQAGATINEALVLKSDATSLQSRASDQWAYYQAKGIKGAVALSSANAYAAAGRPTPDSLLKVAARYNGEQGAIQQEARKLEAERDAKSAEAESLLARHHYYALAIALLQVAIALGAVAALTRQQLALFAAGLLGVGGLGFALYAAFR